MNVSASGEVAAFVDVSQFEVGRSAYECVAFAAALCEYMGAPGGRPAGLPAQVAASAESWYGRLTGSTVPSNMLGVSLEQLHVMLSGMDLRWNNLAISGNSNHASDIALVKASLAAGKPVLICGAETGFYDIALGDRVPYAWTPTGNHAIVATGLASDGNLLVRDTANIGPQGVRPGPRRYDVSKMFLVSGTEIIPAWAEGEQNMRIDLTNAVVAGYFDALSNGQWRCKQNGHVVQYGILGFYRSFGQSAYCGLTYLGLPKSNEIGIDGFAGVVKQEFERGWVVYDLQRAFDNPPGAGNVYLMHLP